MKNILEKLGLELIRTVLIVVIIAGAGYAYAAWSTQVKKGEILTAEKWNQMMGMIEEKSFQGGVCSNGVMSGISKDGTISCLDFEPLEDSWVCPAGMTWSGLSLDCYSFEGPGVGSFCYSSGNSQVQCPIGVGQIKNVGRVSLPINKMKPVFKVISQ
ncbi:hypothetical protein COB57_00085 [Candidatus Peregrinibacteria bacterium]|nr:MAG: hypothetical protein COB57_00085 [Candidatus Peregrinibacteria bacterium]